MAHANGPNIVGQQHPTLLGPTMLWLVASVCMEPQQCWHLLALAGYSLKPVKLLGSCKRTQHCWPATPSNVGSCWHLLRPFAWAFKSNTKIDLKPAVKITLQYKRSSAFYEKGKIAWKTFLGSKRKIFWFPVFWRKAHRFWSKQAEVTAVWN